MKTDNYFGDRVLPPFFPVKIKKKKVIRRFLHFKNNYDT